MTPAKVRQAEKLAAEDQAEEIKKKGSGKQARSEASAVGRAAATRVAGKAAKKSQPPIEVYVGKLIKVYATYSPAEPLITKTRRLLPFIGDLDANLSRALAEAIEKFVERQNRVYLDLAKALRSGNKRRVTALLKGKEEE